MPRISLTHQAELPEGVLISVEGVSKAPPLPLPQPPRWLSRLLPGVEWSAGAAGRRDGEMMDESGEEDLDDYDPEERSGIAFKELNFTVSGGQGLGLVGPDFEVTQTILGVFSGYQPPSTGRIVIRGRIAPLLKPQWLNITGQKGKKAVAVTARVLGWPPDLLRGEKWRRVVEFARLEEVTEFPPDSVEYKERVTRRLLQSAVLHIDATVYLVGYNFNRADSIFAQRCYEVLEQRQREGCAIIQNGVEVEDVSRLCQEAIWVENGDPIFRGRLGEVATFAEERPTEQKEGAAAVPLRATLAGGDGVEIGPTGGTIEIELDVFSKKKLDLELALLLEDELGRTTRLDQPDSLVTSKAGVYRLRIVVPGGLLGNATYQARLLVAGETGSDDDEHELVSFEVVAQRPVPEASVPDLEPVFGELPASEEPTIDPPEVEWNVRRLTT